VNPGSSGASWLGNDANNTNNADKGITLTPSDVDLAASSEFTGEILITDTTELSYFYASDYLNLVLMDGDEPKLTARTFNNFK
jgi:hypothetical protein